MNFDSVINYLKYEGMKYTKYNFQSLIMGEMNLFG